MLFIYNLPVMVNKDFHSSTVIKWGGDCRCGRLSWSQTSRQLGRSAGRSAAAVIKLLTTKCQQTAIIDCLPIDATGSTTCCRALFMWEGWRHTWSVTSDQ